MTSPSDLPPTSSVQTGEVLSPAALNAIVQESADCIKVLDLDARLLTMNAGGQRTMEIDDFSACQNLLWPDFWTGADRLRVDAALDQARLGERSTFEGQAITFKGNSKWWAVQVAPVRNQDGVVCQLLVISRDITAHKQAELALSELNADLERQVEERTRQALRNSQAHQVFMAFTEAVGTQTDVAVLAREAVKILQGHFRDASIGYYRRDQELWTAQAWSDDLLPEAVKAITAGVTSEHPIIAEVLSAQGPVFDYTYLRAAVVSPSSFRAVGSVPLILGSEVCGLLSMGLRETPDWSEQDRQLLCAVARGLNLALERSEKTRQLELEQAALSAFTAFTELVGTETDVKVLIQQAARLLQQTRVVDVAFFEREGDTFLVKHASQDFPPELLARSRQGFTLDQLPFDHALLQEGAALFVNDWTAEKDGVPETSVVAAVAYLPFFQASVVNGMLNMSSRDRARWTERDRGVFRAVGRSLALALERAEYAQLLRERNAELAAQTRALEGMAQLSSELALNTDRDTLIRRALELALSLLPDGFGAFANRAGTVWQIPVRVGDGRSDDLRTLSHLGFPVGQTPSFDQPSETKEPFFQDIYDQSLDFSTGLGTHIGTVATLPLIVSGEVAGVFAVSLFERHRWSAADRALLITTVHSLGLVIEGSIGVAQLAEERRVLALTNDELKSFAYSASHDLRTPVRHVMSFVDLTRDALVTTPNEKASRYLDAVQQAAVRMTDLIDGMLLLSRAGRQTVVLRPVDLNMVVTKVRQDLKAVYPDRQIHWEVMVLPTLVSDLDLLQKALTQLLSNALKFSGTREVTRIRVWAEERGTEWAVFVQDNGVGFNSTYRYKLFGVFQRLHSDKQFGGLGTGLATVRRIIIKLGGDVFAEGQVDQGPTFGFTLPKSVITAGI